ncbi:MAG: putative Ig domain-containing protein [bacterium]|nr:putative Ig domain-containing protein [bacterium]
MHSHWFVGCCLAVCVLHFPSYAVQIQTTTTPPGMVGVPYALTFVAAGGTLPYQWEADFADLPDGLALDDVTGVLSGVPEEQGTATFWVTVTDADNNSASNVFTLIILPASTALFFQTAGLPPALRGQPYAVHILVIGGAPPYLWQVISGAPPAGVTLSTNSGLLAGVPTTNLPSSFIVRVTDRLGTVMQREYTVWVLSDERPMILPAELPDAVVSNLVSYQLSVRALPLPATWSVEFPQDLPRGMAVDFDEGRLYGTPLETGLFSFTIIAESALSGEVARTYNWRILSPPSRPVLPATAPPDGTPGVPYLFQTDATGGMPPYDYTLLESYLPTGFVFYIATATLAGNTLQTGQFWYVLKVSDLLKRSDVRAYTFDIRYATHLTLDTTYLPDGWVGRLYELELRASGGTPPLTWDVAAGTLPPGISLATNLLGQTLGILRGVPLSNGTYWCTLRVTDDVGQTAERVFSFIVHPPPQALGFDTTALPDAMYGEEYEARILVRGGIPPYTWAVLPVTGSLPHGVELIPETGLVGGFPTATGTFNFVCQVTDRDGAQIQRLFTIHVAPQEDQLQFITAVLRNGSINADYFERIYVGGGTPPYTWMLAAGSLPVGISLATNTGVLVGSPSKIGTNTFLISVRDADATEVSRFFTIIIDASPRFLTIEDDDVDDGYVGVPYEFTFSASGGRLPYTWSRPSGSLPPGLILRTDGTLIGTPTAFGAWPFTVRVRDALGSNVVQSYVIRIYNDSEPVITTDELPYGKVGSFYTATLSVVGGTPPYVWSLNPADLPPGLTFNTNSGVISGTIANLPMDNQFFIDVEVTDQAGEWDFTTLELNLDTLDILSVPAASFKLNWNYDLWDRDMFSVKFTARLPAGFTRFDPTMTELYLEFGDYCVWSGNEIVKVNKTGTTYFSKEGNAKRDPFFGGRMDVPVILVKLKADLIKRLLTGSVKVKYDDGTGSDFYLTEDTYSYQGEYPIAIELTIATNTYPFVGHHSVRMNYKGSPTAQKGTAKLLKP